LKPQKKRTFSFRSSLQLVGLPEQEPHNLTAPTCWLAIASSALRLSTYWSARTPTGAQEGEGG